MRPLIEEGGKILQEANGVIRGLDPDGRITSKAKQKTAAHEATPEEYHLAELLKEVSFNHHGLYKPFSRRNSFQFFTGS